MSALPGVDTRLTLASDAVAKVRELEGVLRELPQVEIATEHVLHAGLYARTIRIPAGVVLTGVFIIIPTMLVVHGHATAYIGGESIDLVGHQVIPASAGRKQAFVAHADTYLTMVFATKAKTVEEAEAEFTDEVHLLFSRKPGAINSTNITGE